MFSKIHELTKRKAQFPK